jgi:hypothetical protein
MASSGPHLFHSTAARAAFAYPYRAWRFTQALGRLS